MIYDTLDGWDAEREQADYDQYMMEQESNTYWNLRKKGVCTHEGWHPVTDDPDGEWECADCGKVFSSEEELLNDRRRIRFEHGLD